MKQKNKLLAFLQGSRLYGEKPSNPSAFATSCKVSWNVRDKQGFSFVEVMVSVFVLTIGIIAVISLFSSQLAQLFNSRSQVTAGLLAQEGLEVVRNIRDNNWASGKDAFEVNLPTASISNCAIDMRTTNLAAANCGNTLKQLYYSSGYYVRSGSGGELTKFSRKIDISYPNVTSMKAISMVIWGGSTFPVTVAACNTASKCAYAETTLTNWKD
jgi:Tfp pilus assembly protein PilV